MGILDGYSPKKKDGQTTTGRAGEIAGQAFMRAGNKTTSGVGTTQFKQVRGRNYNKRRNRTARRTSPSVIKVPPQRIPWTPQAQIQGMGHSTGGQAQLGTIIKKKIRPSTFGTTSIVEGQRAYEGGPAGQQRIGTQVLSTGGNRGLGGERKRKLERKKASDRRGASSVGRGAQGISQKQAGSIGGAAPFRKTKGPKIS